MPKRSFHVASGGAAIEKIAVEIYRIPTDLPESDGTLKWDSTTLVLVRVTAAGLTGLGYTYADAATGKLIQDCGLLRVRQRQIRRFGGMRRARLASGGTKGRAVNHRSGGRIQLQGANCSRDQPSRVASGRSPQHGIAGWKRFSGCDVPGKAVCGAAETGAERVDGSCPHGHAGCSGVVDCGREKGE